MCEHCDYSGLLDGIGLAPTPLREAVLKSIGDEIRPLTAVEIIAAVRNQMSINKVTLYRILDLLVDKGLVKRLSAVDRASRYGMGATPHHPNHPHFVCSECGIMECLGPEVLRVDIKNFQRKDNRIVKHVEVMFEGICEGCLKAET